MSEPSGEEVCEVCGRPIVGSPRVRYLGADAVVACGEDCLAVEILRRVGLPTHANFLRARMGVLIGSGR